MGGADSDSDGGPTATPGQPHRQPTPDSHTGRHRHSRRDPNEGGHDRGTSGVADGVTHRAADTDADGDGDGDGDRINTMQLAHC